MTIDRQKLVQDAKVAAQKFQDIMIALGYTFTDEERLEMRRLVPLREYLQGVDTIDSIRGRVTLPVLLADCMEDVINGTSVNSR